MSRSYRNRRKAIRRGEWPAGTKGMRFGGVLPTEEELKERRDVAIKIKRGIYPSLTLTKPAVRKGFESGPRHEVRKRFLQAKNRGAWVVLGAHHEFVKIKGDLWGKDRKHIVTKIKSTNVKKRIRAVRSFADVFSGKVAL